MKTNDVWEHQLRCICDECKCVLVRIHPRSSLLRDEKADKSFIFVMRLWEKLTSWTKKKQNSIKQSRESLQYISLEKFLPKSTEYGKEFFDWLKFTVIQGQLMPCKHIQSDYRWAMEIQAYLQGIAQEREAQANNQTWSYPVSSRSSLTFRFLGGWNPK